MEKTHCDRWAYIPFERFKHNLQKRNNTVCNSLNESKHSDGFPIHPGSTSQLTLQRYLLRKQRKDSREKQYYSHLVSPLQAWRKMH